MNLDLHIYTNSIHCVLSVIQSCCQDMYTLFCYLKIVVSEAVMEYKRINCSVNDPDYFYSNRYHTLEN